ncbi:MAG: mitochondrial fission ELM1 family protein [Candidatus Omnitrophica bacterium]|nr:mitochondrial fission ELM1 family protein [Candidatus Omnitrophota bacterium]
MKVTHTLIDVGGYWAIRIISLWVQRLPLNVALALGSVVGGLTCFLSGRRRVAYSNLKSAFPESTPKERKRWAREMYRHMGMTGVEIMRFPIVRKEYADRYVTYHGYKENYLKHRMSGKGVILLTLHMGNWELSQIIEGLRERPMAVLTRRQKYQRLDQLLNSFRQHYGSLSLGKEKEGIRGLIQTLSEGGCVGVLGDQSGGDEGVWIRFFNRLTTSPKGPMALALKLGVTVLPVFHIRRDGPYHEVFIEPPFELVRTGDSEKDIQINTQNYIKLVEAWISQYPSQWLWGHKRWKRTRTKRILILSDEKTGHIKQSEALVKQMVQAGMDKTPPYEILTEKIEVEFRSSRKKRLFPYFALLFIPWAQGRLSWLRFFLSKESAERLERATPDIVVSAGASLVPLNLCVARENLAKSSVLMKPSFPFNLFRYDLALIPAHDQGLMPRGSFRTQGALSDIDEKSLNQAKEVFSHSIPNPERVRLSLFLGGETRDFKLSLSDIENLLAEIERSSEKLRGDYLITTSRRTPDEVSQFLKTRLENRGRCQSCVIATKDKRPEVVPGMMALADYLIVTEDSLSMISEALSSGKNVIVVKMRQNGLSKKHYRFQELLKKEWGIPVVEAKRLSEVIGREGDQAISQYREHERAKIRERLENLF